MAGSRSDGDVNLLMNEILDALEIIKKQLPNGELKAIQEKITNIDSTQEDMKEDLRAIKRQLLDPEDGIVVRVNKNTEFRKKSEAEEKDFQKLITEHHDLQAFKTKKEAEEKEYQKMLDEHKEILSFKTTVTRVLWIIFTALAGIILAMVFGQQLK
jgi:hypothetical protein